MVTSAAWLKSTLADNGGKGSDMGHDERKVLEKMVAEHNVVTVRYLFDCLESQKLLDRYPININVSSYSFSMCSSHASPVH